MRSLDRMTSFDPRLHNDAFQMRVDHRELLQKNRSYLLHNLCPGEAFWSALLEMGVFEEDLLDEIKSQKTRAERVANLLDLLPHRGPDAFDAFLQALLKCGHGFVADYLKMLEVSDQFKTDIKLYNISDNMQDRLLRTYKKSLPNVQRFFETKLEVNLQEQETDFQEKEREIAELEQHTQVLEAGMGESRTWFEKCVRCTMTLGDEVKRSYILQSALREETKNLEGLYEKASTNDEHEPLLSKFCDAMHSVIDYIKKAEDRRELLEHKLNCGEEEDDGNDANAGQNGKFGTNGKTISSKVQGIIDQISGVMEKMVCREDGSRDASVEQKMRGELEKTINHSREIIKDLTYVKRIFLSTLRKKEDLSQETLSLVHNFREIQRLEKEMNEKQGHIQELSRRSQTLKNKSKRHKRFLEQNQEAIAQKEKQLTELYDHLQKQQSSADQRVHFILSLLPDSGENDGPNTLADDTKSEGGFSLLSRDLTYISIVRDRSDSRFSLRSDKTPAKPPVTSTPTPPKPPVVNPLPLAVTDTRVALIPKKPNGGSEKSKLGVDKTKSAGDKAKSSSNQSRTATASNVVKQSKSSGGQDVDKSKSENCLPNPNSVTTQGNESSTQRNNSGTKLEVPAFSAKNKVHPSVEAKDMPVSSTAQKSNSLSISQRFNFLPTSSESITTTQSCPPPTTSVTTSGQSAHMHKQEVERRLVVGNVTSGLDLSKEEHKELTPQQQTNLIQVKPANDSNVISSAASSRDKEVKKLLPLQKQAQLKQNQTSSKYANPPDKYANKSTELLMSKPMRISSPTTFATTSANSGDGKSSGVQEKGSHRFPLPTPRFSIKSNQHGAPPVYRFSTTVPRGDHLHRPVPALRTKRVNSIEEKDAKMTNGVATPHKVKADGCKTPTIPWSGVSSKQLLRPQNGDSGSVSLPASLTYTHPPARRQDHRVKDEAEINTADSAIVTQPERNHNNEAKEGRTEEPEVTAADNGSCATGENRTHGSVRFSLNTDDNSEEPATEVWIRSVSSDEYNNHNQTGQNVGSDESQNEIPGGGTDRCGTVCKGVCGGDLELSENRSHRQRTLSAETRKSLSSSSLSSAGSIGKQQAEEIKDSPRTAPVATGGVNTNPM